MIRPRFHLPLIVVLLATPFVAFGAGGKYAAEGVDVTDAWARAMPPMQPTSAMFLTLTNRTPVAHALVAADSEVARTVELHTHLMEDGVARMRQVEKIDIPANGQANLAPGGYHVMLIGLHGPLTEGEALSATLTFEDGSSKRVEVPIRGLSYKGGSGAHGGMKCGSGKCGMAPAQGSEGGMKCGAGKCGGGKCGGG